MDSKNIGSFERDLLNSLKNNEDVFFYIKYALEEPDIKEEGDYKNLIIAINDVATARGKSAFAESVELSQQRLKKILKEDSTPSIKNVIAILKAIDLNFTIEEVSKVISDKPASVLDVAQYALTLLSKDSTSMKLQKIVYYSQVQSLVNYNKPLFAEKIQAWPNGPVVSELFSKHKGYRDLSNIALGDASNLSVEQKDSIYWAVEEYGHFDGDTLSDLTHSEDPWKNARKGLPDSAKSNAEITIEAMTEYYSNKPDLAN